LSTQKEDMSTANNDCNGNPCPASKLLKILSGKWKAQIFRLALNGPLRFNSLIRQLEGSNKQAVAVALKELEEEGLFERKIIQLKPLHVEYMLSERGASMISVFQQLEGL
jgi:DNA-binding HxlR family transcriptional regulator